VQASQKTVAHNELPRAVDEPSTDAFHFCPQRIHLLIPISSPTFVTSALFLVFRGHFYSSILVALLLRPQFHRQLLPSLPSKSISAGRRSLHIGIGPTRTVPVPHFYSRPSRHGAIDSSRTARLCCSQNQACHISSSHEGWPKTAYARRSRQ
jgi:hypothetical protein